MKLSERIKQTFGAELDVQPIKDAYKLSKDGERHDVVDAVLDAVNEVIDGYGVEALESHDAPNDRYYFDIVALYVNKGDPYVPTVLYDVHADKLMVCSWGDWLESQETSGRYHFD